MNVVKVSNITKTISKSVILNDISIEIEEGEIVGLIGPSGSGKSTLIKSIIGMEKVDCGSIKLLNKNIPNLDVLQNIGYMAQSDALYEDLTGEENLKFFATLFSIKKNKLKDRINYVSDIVNINEHLSKKVSNYSGGMKRRLSLAIALIQDPKLLILDEPTVGIDPKLRFKIWDELYNLKKQEKSIIITTHVMDEASKCDKLALIREGKIIAKGSPDDIKKQFNADTIEEVFLRIGDDI